jgi:hypothetical protein
MSKIWVNDVEHEIPDDCAELIMSLHEDNVVFRGFLRYISRSTDLHPSLKEQINKLLGEMDSYKPGQVVEPNKLN